MIARNSSLGFRGFAFRLSVLLGAGILLLPMSVRAEDKQLQLPKPADIKNIEFQGPGINKCIIHDRETIEAVVTTLGQFKSDWKKETKKTDAEFVIKLYMEVQKAITIRVDTLGKAAYLQSDTFGDEGSYIRKISLSDLYRLLKLSKYDVSVTLLLPEHGSFKGFIDFALKRAKIRSAQGMDEAQSRKLLYSILDYGRTHRKESNIYRSLMNLCSLEVKSFSKNWTLVKLHGMLSSANMLVNQDGNALPATPENCLTAGRSKLMGQIWTIDNVQSFCSIILDASDNGGMVSKNADIPDYDKHPLPEDKSRLIAPIIESDDGKQRIYKFFSYERLGGVVRQCKLIIKKDTLDLSWEMEEVAKDIGDAQYYL